MPLDKQRSEGAIFETPRDHRELNTGTKIHQSLLNIAGALNISKAIGHKKREVVASSLISPKMGQSMQ